MADIFRKSSIEKLSNPEQLDRAITVSSPMSWLALLGVLVVIVAVVIWSIFGKLPTTVSVSGVITSANDACAVYSDVSGTVSNINKKAGDKVAKGDELATVKTSDGKEVKILAKESGTISQILVNPEEPYVFTGTELFRFTPDFTNKQIIVCYIPSVYAGQLKTGMKLKLYPTSVDTQKSGHMEAEIASIGEFAADNNNMGYVLGFTNGVAQQFLSQGPVVEVVCKIKEDSSTKSGFWWSSRKGKNVELSNGTFVTAKIITDESAPITKLIGNLKEKAEG